MKRNFNETLALVEEILFEPRWDSSEFERIKRQTAEQIKRRAASPSTIASQVFNKLNFGNHIMSNSTSGTVESVESIDLDDLKNYYSTNFSSNLEATFSLSGSLSKAITLESLFFKIS